MPAIESIAAAVQLEQLDQAAGTATVLVSVLVPAALGAAASEDGAVQVCQILQGMGAVCLQGKSEYLNSAQMFCAAVSAVFSGEETVDGWEKPNEPAAPPTFSVKLGTRQLSFAVSFTAERALDDTVSVLDSATWHFRLEEVFPLEAREEAAPTEPFDITVSRTGRTEVFSGCALTAQKRVLEADGQRQIREGVAAGRTVI